MKRRQVIAATGAAVVSTFIPVAGVASSKPQIGDLLAHAFGDQTGRVITPGEIGDELLFAFPLSPDGVLRSGSLHNQLCVLRLDEARMSDETRRFAAGSFVAVSAACTHTGCEVSGWLASRSELECPCHGSRFNVLDAAQVMNGPATQPLAYLPIQHSDDALRVAGKFSRRVGPAPVF